MRPLPTLAPILILCLAPVIASVGEDAQVIQSDKSVLTIYSYGVGEARQFIPEVRDQKPRTGRLNDVIDAPPLSTTVPLRPPGSNVQSRKSTDATIETNTATAAANAPKTMSGRSNLQSDLTSTPAPIFGPRAVSVGWQPSPDDFVVGYNVYTGINSHQYTNKQPVGNQTMAQLPVGAGTIYVAVSAYTAEGIESALSDELIVSTPSQDTSTTSRFIGGGSSSH
jgi:hypothetical protein